VKLNQTIISFLFLLSIVLNTASAGRYYVSPTGSDTNTGSFDFPFKTIQKAVGLAALAAGDTISLRGGVYACSTTVSISKSGISGARILLHAYPGERASVDFSLMPSTSTSRGFSVTGSYWYFKGLDIFRARDNGMIMSGSNNIVEYCTFAENGDTGLQLGGGASNNRIINCDSYYNVDQPAQGNADGFAAKLDVGTGNSFYGCRSWQNSDDGWDGYLRPSNDVTTTLENCWTFKNGYLKDGSASLGNGNGFKMGGSDNKLLMHNFLLKNCVAFDNRVKGFDQNNNRGSMTLYNCTAYRNLADNYRIASFVNYAAGKIVTIKNCAVLGYMVSLNDSVVQQTNSWLAPFDTVTASDFLSIDTTGVRGPRNPDGSLPVIDFFHLAPTSHLVDAGTDVGLPYTGSAPDLGAFERPVASIVGESSSSLPDHIVLLPNYPNPFNPTTTIAYRLPVPAHVRVSVMNLLGQEVAVLFDGVQPAGNQRLMFNATGCSSGVYVCRIQAEGDLVAQRVLLMK
jgi:hypothetical protein